MSKFLGGYDDKVARAIQAHAENLASASRFWPVLALIELALRTTLNTQLEIRNLKRDNHVHWVLDLQNEIRKKNVKSSRDLDQAREILRRTRRSVTPGSIIDEHPLGFWTMLVSKRFKEFWPDLVEGFRGLNSRDSKEIDELLQFFKAFRNRIGHHHVIIFMDLKVANNKLMRLAYLIDPRLEEILKGLDGFEQRASNQTIQE